MTDHEPPEIPLPPPAEAEARCPWCSAPVADPDDVTCGSCGATLHGDATAEIPGVTEIDAIHASSAIAPRKVRRTFGALFVGGDEPIQEPSQAELPALAMPDAEVRREMLRLRLDAELADLTARVAAMAAERGIPMPVVPDAGAGADAAPEAPSQASEAAGGTPTPGMALEEASTSHAGDPSSLGFGERSAADPAAADPAAASPAPPEADARP